MNFYGVHPEMHFHSEVLHSLLKLHRYIIIFFRQQSDIPLYNFNLSVRCTEKVCKFTAYRTSSKYYKLFKRFFRKHIPEKFLTG